MGGREGEDLEGFRDVFLEPTGKARGGLVVADDRGLESPIGFGTVVGVVDASDDLAEGPVPPSGQLFVEFGGSSADLGGGDLEAAELPPRSS